MASYQHAYQNAIDHLRSEIEQYRASIQQYERRIEDLSEKQALYQKLLDLDRQCNGLAAALDVATAELAAVPKEQIRRMWQDAALPPEAVLFIGASISNWLHDSSPEGDGSKDA